MRIYGTGPFQNEEADLQSGRYIVFIKENIFECIEFLKTSQEPAQDLLLHLHMLTILYETFPPNDLIDEIIQEGIEEWKVVFAEWFSRCEMKIPKQYREGIRKSADEIFAKLENYIQ